MWNLLKKSKGLSVASPANGKLVDLTSVNDEAFASKAMGDGFAIELEGNKIYSPVDGEIQVAFPTGHAFGIMSNDVEVLIHIGIDTVNLNGEGFHSVVSVGNKVKSGDLLVELDADSLKNKNYDLTTMILFPNNAFEQKNTNGQIKVGDVVGYAK